MSDQTAGVATLEISGKFLWPPYSSTTNGKRARGTLRISYTKHEGTSHFHPSISWRSDEVSNEGPSNKWPEKPSDCDSKQSYESSVIELGPDLLRFFGGEWIDAQAREDGTDFAIPLSPSSEIIVKEKMDNGTKVRTVECLLQLPQMRSPKETVEISHTCRSIIPARASTPEEANNNLRLSGVHTFDVDSKVFKLFILEFFGAFDSTSGGSHSKVRILLGKRQMRWILGPFQAGQLGSTGLFRNQKGRLEVSLDNTDRLSVPTGASQLWIFLTASWNEKDLNKATMQIEGAWILAEENQVPGIKNLLFVAMRQIETAIPSMKPVLGGQPESFLLLSPAESVWSPSGAAAVMVFNGEVASVSGKVQLPKENTGQCLISLLSPFSRNDAANDLAPGTIGMLVTMRGLEKTDFFNVRLTHDPGVKVAQGFSRLAAVPIASFLIDNADSSVDGYWRAQLGALQLQKESQTVPFLAPPAGGSRLAISWPNSDERVSRVSQSLAITQELRLSVSGVTPLTVDRPWGEREELSQPLLIREQAIPKQGDDEPVSSLGHAPFVLHIRESIAPDRDRWLVVNLIENSTATGEEDETYTLLSREPISVFRFTRRKIDRLGDAGNAIVATFNSDDRTWQMKLAIPEYHFEYPPQVIGESADKPSRLEIHDINAKERSEGNPKVEEDKGDVVRSPDGKQILFMRPAPSMKGVKGDPERSYLIECRLTPSLDLWVRPSDLERGYFQPEWQAYEIFRQRNDFGIGVALRGLRGEFLYGLMVGVNPQLENGPAAQARVAEIEAITGRIPAYNYVTADGGKLLQRWGLVRLALLKRFERLDIWTPAYDQTRPFGYSRFSNGVSFALRKTALHRLPAPVPEGRAFDSSIDKDGIRIDKDHGLSGGALWPLESLAFVNRIRELPTSDGGTIERIAISPTGGDANQSAKFLNGRMTVVSETRDGFVQMQKIEILGRISVFWHRAKHVVVYERTVNPSEQFAPVWDADGWHKSRSRRAIIRKVCEYIEIMEPSRSYPDDPGATGKSTFCGFLDSVRFNSKIIHVDSAWSEEIDQSGVTGYTIPLWNLGASQLRPNVYPMPGVTSVTVGEGKESRPLQPRQIANPENIYFYAQASGTEGDTNKWLPVYGVDYGNLIDPVKLEQMTAPGGSGYGAPGSTSQPGRKPSSPRLLPGYHRFTWRLLPDGARTVLNSGFGGNPVFGSLESFTFSRGTVAEPPKSGLLKSHLDHADAISAVSEISEFLTDSASRLMAAAAIDDASLLKEAAKIVAPFQDIERSFKERISNLPNQGAIDSVKDSIELGKVPISCDQIKKQISTTLLRKQKLVAQALRDWQADLNGDVQKWADKKFKDTWDKVDKTLSNRDRIIRTIVHEDLLGLKRNLDELFGDIQTTADGILGQVATASRLVHECVADFSETFRRSVMKVRTILDTSQGQLEWSQDRYRKLREQINEQLAGLISELTAIRTEVSQRLGAELSPLGAGIAQAIATKVQKTLDTLTADFKKLSLAVDNPGKPDEVTKRIRDVVSGIEDAAKGLNSFETNLINEINKASKGMSETFGDFSQKMKDATRDVLQWGAIGSQLLVDVGDDTVNRIAKSLNDAKQIAKDDLELIRGKVQAQLLAIPDFVAEAPALDQAIGAVAEDVEKLCDTIKKFFDTQLDALIPKGLKETFEIPLNNCLAAYEAIKKAGSNIDDLKKAAAKLQGEAASISADWNKTVSSAQAYSSRVMEGFNKLGKGGVAAVPGNALRLLSAATAAPEIAQMQANIDRMRCSYNNAKVETSKALASLSKLGDALKALGIEIPFNGISDQLNIPDDVLQGFDFKRLFPSFGGLDLSGLLGDVKIPPGVKDAVRIRHEFDKAKFRAWVEVDADVPVPGRKKLFGLGPFVMYFRDSLLTGRMRAEASQDSDQATTSGAGVISTNIDVDIGGERILSLERGEIRFSQGSGLKFSFDAKNIKLHSSLQFVQDTLGQLVGDNIGGMKILKERGIPVGVEHDFKLPTISLMGVTSGVSNIQLSNTFRLRAYPDFVLSNRFNLSRPELPFIFSFFIVGGTGYSVVDASYRPFDQSLSVSVEGAAGGSAALGVAFGPVSGSVFFTLSLALTYKKTVGPSGASGDGLTVSFVMVMAGNVTVWGLIDIYLGMMLRLSYQENGAIDAMGSVSIEVEVSMFLTLSFSAEVQFRMKDGNSSTTTQTDTSISEGERIKQLREKADQLQGARA